MYGDLAAAPKRDAAAYTDAVIVPQVLKGPQFVASAAARILSRVHDIELQMNCIKLLDAGHSTRLPNGCVCIDVTCALRVDSLLGGGAGCCTFMSYAHAPNISGTSY